jgi:hypothetical protein
VVGKMQGGRYYGYRAKAKRQRSDGSDTSSQAQTESEPATQSSQADEGSEPWENCVHEEDDENNSGGRRLIHQTRPDAKGQRRVMTDEEARQSMSELKGIYDIFTD